MWQVRVQLEIVNDKALKDEIANQPSRAFLKTWKENGELSDFLCCHSQSRLFDDGIPEVIHSPEKVGKKQTFIGGRFADDALP
jgi:hypothetical protein